MIRILLALPLLLSLAPAPAAALPHPAGPATDGQVLAVAAEYGEQAARTATGLEILQDIAGRLPADGSGAAHHDRAADARRLPLPRAAVSLSASADARPDTRLSCGARLPYFPTAPPPARQSPDPS